MSFSQIDTNKSYILIEEPISRLIIKDIIERDKFEQENIFYKNQINLLESKIQLQDSLITNFKLKESNYTNIILLYEEKQNLSESVIKELNIRLNKEINKNKIYKYGGGALILVLIGSLLSN